MKGTRMANEDSKTKRRSPATKLCEGCGQPMLPDGVKKLPNEYDHAQGCPLDKATQQVEQATPWTPGPWKVARYENYVGFSIWADGVGCIAERWWPTEEKSVPIEANAHLIAAAPALYEALEEWDNLMAQPSGEEWRRKLARTRAALAAARGEVKP